MTFLQKSYGEYSKDEKPVLVTRSYKGLDLEMDPVINDYNNINVVSDSDSNESDNKFFLMKISTMKTK